MSEFTYTDQLPLGDDSTRYRLLSTEGVSVELLGDHEFLRVESSALTALTFAAMRDISHLLRSDHLSQLKKILDDPEASPNDRFVALDLLKNANIAAGGSCPCAKTLELRSLWASGANTYSRRAKTARTFLAGYSMRSPSSTCAIPNFHR